MPELPDVLLYITALRSRLLGATVDGVTVRSPSLLRSFEPPIEDIAGRTVQSVDRLGKQIVWQMQGNRWLVFHLMIQGRFHWRTQITQPTRKVDLAAFYIRGQTLLLTETGSKKRARLTLLCSHSELARYDRQGLNVLNCTPDDFRQRLMRENRTLKRALTDPRILDGIGNAYSDEILHAAGMSPFLRTRQLNDEEWTRLLAACRRTLETWTARLQDHWGDRFPEKVTAFQPQMAVHGRYGEPCPICQTAVQRVRYADSELNYCPRCQTDGRLLADRSLSRLMRQDWPRSIDELES